MTWFYKCFVIFNCVSFISFNLDQNEIFFFSILIQMNYFKPNLGFCLWIRQSFVGNELLNGWLNKFRVFPTCNRYTCQLTLKVPVLTPHQLWPLSSMLNTPHLLSNAQYLSFTEHYWAKKIVLCTQKRQCFVLLGVAR